MHAIRWIQADALAVGLQLSHPPFRKRWPDRISGMGCRILLRSVVADVGVVNDQVRRLIFLVLGARVIEVGQLVEGQFAIAFRRAQEVGFGSAVSGELASFFMC